MSKHTPGPWVVLPEEVDRPYIRIRGTRLGCRYKVANVIALDYEGVPAREADETRANARLIAAAPELLSSLITLLDAVDDIRGIEIRDYCRREVEEAERVIAKARGES